MRRHSLVAGAPLVGAPALLAGCGGSVGTITVGEPAAAQAPTAVPAATVEVGPGIVRHVVVRGGYRVTIRVTPNRASRANHVVVAVSQAGIPVTGAHVGITASMLTMDMGTARYRLAGSGTYAVTTPAWLMPGLWELGVTVRPPGGAAVSVGLADDMRS
jgi:YtkA-like